MLHGTRFWEQCLGELRILQRRFGRLRRAARRIPLLLAHVQTLQASEVEQREQCMACAECEK